MDIENPQSIRPRSLSPLERARLLSEAVSDAARRARFSSKGKRRMGGGGFQARKGQTLFRLAAIGSFWLMVALPTLAAAIYFGLIASSQYVTEYKFTVAGADPLPIDGFAQLTGIPAMAIVQDTQIVTNNLETRAAVESLEKKVGLRARYSRDEIDFLSRVDPSKPVEKIVRYWSGMIDAAIKMPSGIVEVKVKAFTPEDSLAIGRATLELSEELINDLNDRMNRDALSSAEAEVERASQRLTKARIALEKAQNEEGLLDIQKAAEGMDTLVNEMKSTLQKLEQEYNTQLKSVRETAPQMQPLKARIAALRNEIASLQAKVTSGSATGVPEATLSKLMIRFSELNLEREIAEKLYAGSIASMEIARINSERKRMYLNAFVLPSLPEEAKYPRRGLMIFFTALGSLALWAGIGGTVSLIRNHMA